VSEERIAVPTTEPPELRTAAVPAGPALAVRSRPGPIVPLLAASDAIALVAAFMVTSMAIPTMNGRAGVHAEGVLLFALALPCWFAGARLYGLYAAEPGRELLGRAGEWTNVGRLMMVGTWLLLAIAWLAGRGQPATARLVVFAAVAVVFVVSGRMAVRAAGRRRSAYAQSAVIVGAGDVGQLVARKLLHHPEYGIELVGFVDAPPKRVRREVAGVPVLGAMDDLAEIVRERGVDRVIVAFSKHNDGDVLTHVRPLMRQDVRVDVVPRMFEIIGPDLGLPNVEGIPLVSLSPRRRPRRLLLVKRGIDIVGASLGLVLAATVFVWAWWRIPRETPGPVFFRQTRLGANMHEFTMLKFRTMSVDADASGHRDFVAQSMNVDAAAGELYKLDRHDVITPTGRSLRRLSLDELPQLWNVLRGDMSLVGPRPCLDYETEHFAPHHYERFQMPAGITGLWQVTARAHAPFAEALEMDVAYVRSWSLGLDLRLIVRTPAEMLRQRKATV
jgi:exopolysaccharide biosynthesis polyprenyl glycosylphosphotransferase